MESHTHEKIKKRFAFLELGETEARQIRKLGLLLKEQKSRSIDELFDYLQHFQETSPYFSNREVALHLKNAQKEYFESLFEGAYDDEYIKSRKRVGEMHYGMGLTPDIYISTYTKYINLVLAEAAKLGMGQQEYQAYTQDLLKIMMFDISIAIDSYIQAGEQVMHQHVNDLESINKAAMELAVSASTKDRVRKALQQVLKVIRSKAAVITLYDISSATLTEWETLGIDNVLVKQHVQFLSELGQQTLSGTVPLTQEEIPPKIRQSGFDYITAVPLHYGENAVGVLYIFEHEQLQLTTPKTHKLLTLSHLIVNAIVNARVHEETLFQATHDPLTGLANRRLLDKQLEESLERCQRTGSAMTLIMIDIDHFKEVNDSYGHAAGDLVLKEVARIVKTLIRKVDLAVRFGGEEIYILLEGFDGSTAKTKADEIRQTIEATPMLLADGSVIHITMSAGVVCYPRCAENIGSMLEKGDQALYMAKQDGRNQVILYRDMLKSVIEENPHRITELLHDGYENIQPIVTAIDMKSRYFREHSNQVARMAAGFAHYLGLDKEQSTILQRAALLQNIGLIFVPENLLDKSDKLTAEETVVYQQHAIKGAELMEGIAAYAKIAEVVRHHHESYDGKGYPDGLCGEEIPWHARILCILDAYNSMISDRPYRDRLSHQDAIAAIEKSAKHKFDPELAARFVAFINSQ